VAAFLEAAVATGALAGAVLLRAHGAAVEVTAVGRRALDGDAPMDRDTIFRIASMTKPMTAALALMLVEDGRIRLDDPVRRWLPELAAPRVLRVPDGPLDDTVPATRPIIVEDLLTFQMGLGFIWEATEDWPIQRAIAAAGLAPGPSPPALAPDELMRRLGALPLVAQPGTRWLYHTSYDPLAVLIARVGGRPFAVVLEDRLLAPLGMTDTGFAVPPAKRARLAGCCVAGPDGGLVERERDGLEVTPGGSSGLFSTADDLLAFARLLLNRGGHGGRQLLTGQSVELMTTDRIAPAVKAASPFFPGFWETHGWGLGVAVTADGYGWDGGYGTAWRNRPAAGEIAILLIQRPFDETVIGLHAAFHSHIQGREP
jgi:CubicO group peptidase (beta-lactamase class C family)